MGTLAKAASRRTPGHDRRQKATSIADAKAHFSSLVRKVERDRSEVIVMRRGLAVAKIVPIAEPEVRSGYGWMRGTVEELGDIVGPTGEEWDVTGE